MAVAIPVGAELDERSATAAANRAQRVFADAGRDAGRQFSDSLAQGMRSGEDTIRKSAGRASDAYDKMADAAGRVREAEDKLERARSSGNSGQIVSRAEALERARRAEARATREAAEAYRDYEDAAGGAGRSLMDSLRGSIAGAGTTGRDAAGEFVGGFAGASMLTRLGASGGPIGLALAGVGVLGVGAGRLLAAGITEGLSAIQLQDQFQASMGLDEASMSRFANAAGQAYANNFGASLADNLSAARSALQSGLIESNSSDVDVQNVIQQVQGVSSVTGASAQELSRSVTTLMRTGFAGSVSEALDVITAGFQKGMDVSNDWLDTINEYSTQFRKLGLDAGEFMTLLHQGLEGGARDTDKVADSLKEFSIRAVDGSKATKEGFEALGFNADEMGRRFAEGGESAKVAFGAVLEALRSTGDAQQQALIWQRLFGTQWEDMGDAISRLSLDPAKNEFRDLQGTSETATKTATDNFKSEWEAATRAVSQAFSNLKTDIADWFTGIPGLRELLRAVPLILGGGEDFKGPPIPTAPKVYGPQIPLPVTGPPVGGGLGDLLNPGAGGSGSGLPSVLNGPQLAPPGSGNFYKQLYPQQPAAAGPAAPVPGAVTPIPGADAGSGSKAKPSFDPSQYSVDAIPVPGATPGTGLPTVPVLPGAQTGPGYYQVDPQRVYDSETSLMSARNSVEQARIRVLELEADNTTTAQDLLAAKNSVTMAERQYTSAQMKLAEAQQGTWKKMESTAKSFSQGMDQIGVALDNDLGISKGLPGLAENLVKLVGSLAAAPLEAQLAAISKYNPIQGGHGLVGILGAQGVFGPQYTQSQYAQQGYGPTGQVAARPTGAPSEAQVKQIAAAFGLQVTSEDRPGDPGYHGRGMALDVSNGSGNTPQMRAFAEYMSQNFGPYLKELIYSDGSFGGLIGDGKNVTGSSYYGPDTLSEHQNHVHVAAQWGSGINAPYTSGNVTPPAGNFSNFGAPGSPQAIANMIYQQAIGRGYSPHEAQSIVAYAIGESSLNPGISGGVQGDAEVVGLFQQKPAFAAGGGIDPSQRADPAANTYAYLNQLEKHRDLPIEQALPATSVGGPLASGPGAQPQAWGPLMAQAGDLLGFGPGGAPATPPLAGVPSMPGGMMPGVGAPQAAPFARTPGTGGIAFPAMPGGGGFGIDGGGLLGTAMAAGGTALDLTAPGAGQAAQIGMKLLNRTIQYGSQAAGIGVSGLMETFLPSGSPLGSIGNSWFGKLAAGFASARPALPNVAGQQAPPNPNGQGQGNGQPGTSVGTNIEKLEYNNHQASEDRAGADLSRHLEAQNAPAGQR